jgi:hypothetical protein
MNFLKGILLHTSWWRTILMLVGGAILICVALYCYKIYSAHMDEEKHNAEALGQLDTHDTSILLCLRATSSGDGPVVARFIFDALQKATSPYRVNCAVLQVGTTEDVMERYIDLTRDTSTDFRRNIRTLNMLPEDQGGNAGSFSTAWRLWNTTLRDHDQLLLVIDPHRHRLKKGWDVAMEHVLTNRLSQTSPGVFSACGSSSFPTVRKGRVDHNFFPTVAPAQTFDKTSETLIPSIAVDHGLIACTSAAAAKISSLPHCPDSAASVVLSDAFHKRGVKMWTGVCERWVERSHESELVVEWRPDKAALPKLSRPYCKFANIDPQSTDPYVTGVRARMGMTPNHTENERFYKWGTMSGFVAARKRETYEHKRMMA